MSPQSSHTIKSNAEGFTVHIKDQKTEFKSAALIVKSNVKQLKY